MGLVMSGVLMVRTLCFTGVENRAMCFTRTPGAFFVMVTRSCVNPPSTR